MTARSIRRSVSALCSIALTPLGFAHGGNFPSSDDDAWWQFWNPDPLILFNLVILGALYALGLHRMMLQRSVAEAPVRPHHVLAFSLGLLGVAIALLSPVDVLADELQWVHMVQHMVLMNIAAPLFVLGAPVRVMLWVLPPPQRARVGRWKQDLERRGVPRYLFWQPVGLWTLYAVMLWIWHVPALYEAALANELVHHGQHLTFFVASCLFWRVLFDPIGRLRLGRMGAIVYLFLTSMHATVLGVFMALAPRLWYPAYLNRTASWGFDALEDQQLAGYIMWMPACMIYAVFAAILFASWLQTSDPGPHPRNPQTKIRASTLHNQAPKREPLNPGP